MAFRGERFVLDLDSDDDHHVPSDPSTLAVPGMIGEIRERSPTTAPAPPKPPTTGFPAHRRRTKQSAFKQRREDSLASSITPNNATAPVSRPDTEKTAIGEENRRQLASMSPAQIQQEKEELMETMDSSLLERFLRRARIDSDDTPSTSRPPPPPSEPPTAIDPSAKTPVAEEQHPSEDLPASKITTRAPNRDDLPPSSVPEDLHPASELPAGLHFPTPPSQTTTAPNLDPSSPSFLSDLQTHYFPNISHDPSALSWLQPASADPEDPDSTSAYHPASSADAVHPSALRFSLLGTVLSPSTSLSLSTNLGLHHHGDDPHAAGYTIPELAILSRSSFPAQRCVAWQVLGRILFRLGKCQFGERGSPLVEGLWFVIEKEGVVAGMLAEADGASSSDARTQRSATTVEAPQKQQKGPSRPPGAIGRHASATAWAVEGVWLWQMGGAGDRGVLKEGTIRSQ
ncbi:RNA polymerase II associated protein 1 [Aspergillus nanangensis]|uniref:RNA polymerase II associated protein 1 n=1 Tax=Aspergillus nanangensis TaxID=2582783 RepID=A0AAD4CSR1_ASPNN|nr:RNA polymerase II associated protein 1 [Aspergillus nanangensis]